jgi:LacI family transcriptional regulator
MQKKISIKDIAAKLKISITTVSFILNGKSKEKGISDGLAERVLKYVQETGYRPHHLAQSLRTGRTKIICLLVESIDDPFFSAIAAHLEEVASQYGYKIIYGSTKNEVSKSRELIQLFKDRQVDGFIITPSEDLENDIISLKNDNIPLVLVDRYYSTIDTDWVVIDNFQSTYNAVSYFARQNYKQIAFVTLESSQTQMLDRLNGYKKAVEEAYMKPLVCKIDYAKVEQTGASTIMELLSEHPEIDSLFFATSYLALKGIGVINELNKSVSTDYGVIAFDDHTAFKLFRPTITAVAQPVGELSKQVFELLMEQIDQPSETRKFKHIVVPAELIVRNSSPCKIDVKV